MSRPEAMVAECQTCHARSVWRRPTDGTAWAVWHSRETGHPDNYRAVPLEVESIRGRVWWDSSVRRWRFEVAEPGLISAWGTAFSFLEAQSHCRRAVEVSRRHPVLWSADDD